MTKNGSRKVRLDSLKARVEKLRLGDVTLAEFADSNVPKGKGRLRKSKSVLQEVRKISTSEDVNNDSSLEVLDDEDEPELLKGNTNGEDKNESSEEVNNNEYTEYPLKIWLLLADYILPEDIKSFSLICKATLSVVNTPLFWIRLYKRYYCKKRGVPKCLSRLMLDYQIGMKQRVIRSLYYFYSPFVAAANNYSPLVESAVGNVCLHHWVYSIEEKESREGRKWIYNFKFCNRNVNYIFKSRNKSTPHLNDIHYNAEKGCSLLTIVRKEFIVLPNLMGMRLKNIVSFPKSLSLTFSSAPLTRKPLETDTLSINLEHIQRPRLIPWWHPDYWDHGKCCKHILKS